MKKALTKNNKAIVSSKGQVVIPRAIRESLGIHAGHELLFEASEDGMIAIKPIKRSIENFFGRCRQAQDKEPCDIDDAIMTHVSENDEKTLSNDQDDEENDKC